MAYRQIFGVKTTVRLRLIERFTLVLAGNPIFRKIDAGVLQYNCAFLE